MQIRHKHLDLDGIGVFYREPARTPAPRCCSHTGTPARRRPLAAVDQPRRGRAAGARLPRPGPCRAV